MRPDLQHGYIATYAFPLHAFNEHATTDHVCDTADIRGLAVLAMMGGDSVCCMFGQTGRWGGAVAACGEGGGAACSVCPAGRGGGAACAACPAGRGRRWPHVLHVWTDRQVGGGPSILHVYAASPVCTRTDLTTPANSHFMMADHTS